VSSARGAHQLDVIGRGVAPAFIGVEAGGRLSAIERMGRLAEHGRGGLDVRRVFGEQLAKLPFRRRNEALMSEHVFAGEAHDSPTPIIYGAATKDVRDGRHVAHPCVTGMCS
jgi:hypothetical protein